MEDIDKLGVISIANNTRAHLQNGLIVVFGRLLNFLCTNHFVNDEQVGEGISNLLKVDAMMK